MLGFLAFSVWPGRADPHPGLVACHRPNAGLALLPRGQEALAAGLRLGLDGGKGDFRHPGTQFHRNEVIRPPVRASLRKFLFSGYRTKSTASSRSGKEDPHSVQHHSL